MEVDEHPRERGVAFLVRAHRGETLALIEPHRVRLRVHDEESASSMRHDELPRQCDGEVHELCADALALKVGIDGQPRQPHGRVVGVPEAIDRREVAELPDGTWVQTSVAYASGVVSRALTSTKVFARLSLWRRLASLRRNVLRGTSAASPRLSELQPSPSASARIS